MSALRRFKSVLVLAATAFGVAAMPAAADIYSFKDEKGVVHFTNISGLDKRYKLVRKESPSAYEHSRSARSRARRYPAGSPGFVRKL